MERCEHPPERQWESQGSGPGFRYRIYWCKECRTHRRDQCGYGWLHFTADSTAWVYCSRPHEHEGKHWSEEKADGQG